MSQLDKGRYSPFEEALDSRRLDVLINLCDYFYACIKEELPAARIEPLIMEDEIGVESLVIFFGYRQGIIGQSFVIKRNEFEKSLEDFIDSSLVEILRESKFTFHADCMGYSTSANEVIEKLKKWYSNGNYGKENMILNQLVRYHGKECRKMYYDSEAIVDYTSSIWHLDKPQVSFQPIGQEHVVREQISRRGGVGSALRGGSILARAERLRRS